MDIFHYAADTGEFTHTSQARALPMREGLPDNDPSKWQVPAGATTIAPPATGATQIAVFADGAWTIEDDYRGLTYYGGPDGRMPVVIEDIGSPADMGLTLTPAPLTAKEVAAIKRAEISRERNRRIALGHTVTLSDGRSFRVDTRDATDFRNIQCLVTKAMVMQMTAQAGTVTFRDADNVDQVMTPALTIEMGVLVGEAVDAIYKKSWDIKDTDPMPKDVTDQALW